MKKSTLLITLLALNLSACSTIKSMFPDKEKDYQYTNEIAPLVLPDDLGKNFNVGASNISPAVTPLSIDSTSNVTPLQPKTPVAFAEPATKDPVVESTVTNQAPIQAKLIAVEVLENVKDAHRLRLGVASEKAWRIVAKALSRQSIEVTQRHQASGLFTIQYDANETKVADGSYWDELVFMFKGFQSHERAYELRLSEDNGQTEVTVLDGVTAQPLADAVSLHLLTLLQKTIKADLAK
jgi:outer membrane protein assembly factor BamC